MPGGPGQGPQFPPTPPPRQGEKCYTDPVNGRRVCYPTYFAPSQGTSLDESGRPHHSYKFYWNGPAEGLKPGGPGLYDTWDTPDYNGFYPYTTPATESAPPHYNPSTTPGTTGAPGPSSRSATFESLAHMHKRGFAFPYSVDPGARRYLKRLQHRSFLRGGLVHTKGHGAARQSDSQKSPGPQAKAAAKKEVARINKSQKQQQAVHAARGEA